MICDTCKWAGRVTGFPDGEDMFVCDCKDPRVPFTMEEDSDCPCYEEVQRC